MGTCDKNLKNSLYSLYGLNLLNEMNLLDYLHSKNDLYSLDSVHVLVCADIHGVSGRAVPLLESVSLLWPSPCGFAPLSLLVLLA